MFLFFPSSTKCATERHKKTYMFVWMYFEKREKERENCGVRVKKRKLPTKIWSFSLKWKKKVVKRGRDREKEKRLGKGWTSEWKIEVES